MTNSPRLKIEPSTITRPLDPSALQRPPSGPINPSGPTSAPPSSSNGVNNGTPGGGVNPNAAPGPIPATTPLVVRQDNNGVQWIAFEYSRDRVKMEYTIRCDVESVNVEELTQDFKTENCVYPRACCAKDQYRGNRLVYETECNTVGWALANLNPLLRGKRGLIQRAVDSWRNSNQDPKLRSRRVRRMAKINNRKPAHHPPHAMGTAAPPAGPSGAHTSTPSQRPQGGNVAIGGTQLHHHHAHPDGSNAAGPDDVSVSSGYSGRQVPNGYAGPSNNDMRQAQVFHGYATSYPQPPNGVSSIPPNIHNGMDGMAVGANVGATKAATLEDEEQTTAMYGDLPENKRRKFIVVEDSVNKARVRVRVTLDQVDMKELPDSYRKSNSVYPRSYFPMQMQSPPSSSRGSRFFEDGDPEGGDSSDTGTTRGRTLVPVPMVDASDAEIAVPKLTRARKRREVTLNDLGYRLSWSQSRTFSGRLMFLQKSLDAYRNKVRATIIQTAAHSPGKEAVKIAPHFETRVGKRKYLERSSRSSKRASTP
ncbi:hypothetical protein MMC25_001614 [Agyrium rufum]|nr:hypothetical protein [Agyrium rufum]